MRALRPYLLLALLFGCGGSGTNITTMVGPAGGMVGQSNGSSVSIPMGALGASTNITITSVSVTPPAGLVLVGQAYDFGPDGTTFAQAVTITLPFEAGKIPSGRTASDILIYTAARGSSDFSPLQTSLVSASVTTQTSHFTVYAPMAPAASSTGGSDMSMSGAADMTPAQCTPSCTTGTNMCSCTETCGTTMYSMSCVGSGTLFNCSCEINGQTQSTTLHPTSCSDQSTLISTFGGCLG